MGAYCIAGEEQGLWLTIFISPAPQLRAPGLSRTRRSRSHRRRTLHAFATRTGSTCVEVTVSTSNDEATGLKLLIFSQLVRMMGVGRRADCLHFCADAISHHSGEN
jgi:hypothetical protein